MKHIKSYINADIEHHLKGDAPLSFKHIYKIGVFSSIGKWTIGIMIVLVAALFLPWTQNIKAKGKITTLRQEQRAQEVNAIIAGKIVKWYVKEGDMVKAGDTLLQLGEVKVDYFDPQLLGRTEQQINAKQQSIEGYKGKAGTADKQVQALQQALELKLASLDNKIRQQLLKVESDSMDVLAAANDLNMYKRQINAAKTMLDSGAISLNEFEKRKSNYQSSLAKKTSAENKFLQGKQELINLRIEKNSVVQDYTDKVSKAEGDKFSAISQVASTEADVAKLKSIYSSYDVRNKLYYVTAPQGGQVAKAMKAGVGEMVKEGEMIVEIIPTQLQFAVEMYVQPVDLPLISKGQEVRFMFDGFPAIVFSGWPDATYGTFSGKVTAIENNVSDNGMFRVLVAEDTTDKHWPKQLRLGGGAQAIALLKNVPVYYELWRNINGFPPEYYTAGKDQSTKKAKK
ncbi:MAG: HlyD family efflux transporter periplasmic adaptor subunit [Bacteroidota bacterium]|nr:HlyD family efflux transporter periplasmic adaptor subunit [Bacteroidota bacterium]